MYELKIDYDGYGEEFLTHLKSEEIREIGKEDMASLFTVRTEINPDDISKGHDRAYLRIDGEEVFGGVVEDVVRHDTRKEIIVESFERLAERVEPGPKVDQWIGAKDSDIIRDAISEVDGLQAGDIETTNTNVTYHYSNASPAFKARKAADVSSGYLLYRPDGTVDYGHLGQNKSHYTLSPRDDNVSADFELEEEAGYENVTHLRMLGAGEQEHQISATAVADSYDGGEQIWKTHTDKAIADADTLQSKADHYVSELATVKLDVSLTVKGVQCAVGDTFRVYLPTEDVDEILEIVKHKRVIDTEGIKHKVTLSNHRDTREDPEDKSRSDVENYNQAIEGAPMAIDGGGSRQPVNGEHNWETVYDYLPGVVHEHRVELKVEGQPYRAYSSGAGAGGGPHEHDVEIDTTSTNNSEFTSTVTAVSDHQNTTLTQNWTDIGSAAPVAPTQELFAHFSFDIAHTNSDSTQDGPIEYRLEVEDSNGSVHYQPRQSGFHTRIKTTMDTGQTAKRYHVSAFVPENLEGEIVTFQMRLGGPYDGDFTADGTLRWQGAGLHTHDVQQGVTSTEEVGEHTHDAEPGIIEEFGDTQFYPSNCDVLINGQSMGVSLGDGNGVFSEVVDLRGELQEGDNRIEVTSDTLGHVQAFVQGEAYRQILGRSS